MKDYRIIVRKCSICGKKLTVKVYENGRYEGGVIREKVILSLYLKIVTGSRGLNHV